MAIGPQWGGGDLGLGFIECVVGEKGCSPDLPGIPPAACLTYLWAQPPGAFRWGPLKGLDIFMERPSCSAVIDPPALLPAIDTMSSVGVNRWPLLASTD